MHGLAQGALDIAGRQGGQRGGGDLAWPRPAPAARPRRALLSISAWLLSRAARSAMASAAMRAVDGFGGADLAGFGAFARGLRPAAVSISSAVRVFFWRARAASETTSPSAAEFGVEGEFVGGCAHQ